MKARKAKIIKREEERKEKEGKERKNSGVVLGERKNS